MKGSVRKALGREVYGRRIWEGKCKEGLRKGIVWKALGRLL